MGSMITLGVGRLEIDWGKNNSFISHSKLFLPGDLKNATYYYAGNHRERQPAYRRTLLSVRRRLALLGYTMERCREIFDANISYSERFGDGHTISWSDFTTALTSVDLDRADAFYKEGEGYDPGEYAEECILSNPSFENLLPSTWSQRRGIGLFLENVHPYVTLCVLANSPRNSKRYVVWRHADIVDGGWVEEEELKPALSPEDKYLVVTEGSSDSAILQKSLYLLFPDVADFFSFIDMSEHYPFTGTGNLVNFCKGLAKIGIQNKVLVVVDNDTAGMDALNRMKDVDLPPSMKMTALPNMKHLKRFRTIGPNGPSYEDINGRAASIELYLDLRHGVPKQPAVRWTSYSSRVGTYQGELVEKEKYTETFLKLRGAAKGYEYAHLREVWRALFKTCTGESF